MDDSRRVEEVGFAAGALEVLKEAIVSVRGGRDDDESNSHLGDDVLVTS